MLVYRDENLSDWVCVKSGRGGVVFHADCQVVDLLFGCPKYQFLLMFYWYFDHFGSPFWGPWGVHFEIASTREPVNSRRRWICRAAGG